MINITPAQRLCPHDKVRHVYKGSGKFGLLTEGGFFACTGEGKRFLGEITKLYFTTARKQARKKDRSKKKEKNVLKFKYYKLKKKNCKKMK